KLSKQGDLRDCFQERDLEYLDLYGMTFSGERLAGMSFRGSFLVEATFRRSALIRASFAGAYLRNADFAEADLSGVNLTDADWFNALGFTRSELARVRHDILIDCPATLDQMHRYLETHYV